MAPLHVGYTRCAQGPVRRGTLYNVSHPSNNGCLPLNYSGNPGVNGVSHREGQAAVTNDPAYKDCQAVSPPSVVVYHY